MRRGPDRPNGFGTRRQLRVTGEQPTYRPPAAGRYVAGERPPFIGGAPVANRALMGETSPNIGSPVALPQLLRPTGAEEYAANVPGILQFNSIITEAISAASQQVSRPISDESQGRIYYELGSVMSQLDVEEPVAFSLGLYDSDQVDRNAAVDVNSTENEGQRSLFDPRMGTLSANVPCLTCSQVFTYCPGHPGKISLHRRIYHPGYIREIVYILQSVCNSCGKTLMSPAAIEQGGYLQYRGLERLKMIATETAKAKLPCTVPKEMDFLETQMKRLAADDPAAGLMSPVRISPSSRTTNLCRANPNFNPTTSTKRYEVIYVTTNMGATGSDKAFVVLPVKEVRKIFSLIDDQTARLLGFSDTRQIQSLIIRKLLVIPPNLRPDSTSGGKSQDYLTAIYRDIIKANNQIEGIKKTIHSLRSLLDQSGHGSAPAEFVKSSPEYATYEWISQEFDKKSAELKQVSDGLTLLEQQYFQSSDTTMIIQRNELIKRRDRLQQDISLLSQQIAKQKPKVPRITQNRPDVVRIYNDINKAYSSIDILVTTKLMRSVYNLISSNPDPDRKSQYQNIHALLQGKKGAIRRDAMGKRVDRSGRTVVSPDPSLRFGEIYIPRIWARLLTIPVTVDQENQGKLIDMGNRGMVRFIRPYRNGQYDRRITYDTKKTAEEQIRIRDQVERYMQDGDYVIMNRQPTLHKQGFFSFQVRLTESTTEQTIRVHLSVVQGYNMDFDGDEANIVVPVTPEAYAEVVGVMSARRNIMNGQNNCPNFGLAYDAIPGSFFATDDNTMVDDGMIDHAFTRISNPVDRLDWLRRCQKNQINPNSGKAYFSICFPSDFRYKKGDVEIADGILVKGQLTKKHVGTSPDSIVAALYFKYGNERAADFLTDGTFLAVDYLTVHGSTITMTDFLITPELQTTIFKIIDEGQKRVSEHGGRLDDPFEEQRRQENILTSIRQLDNDLTDQVIRSLPTNNHMLQLVKSGAKGNTFNIFQSLGAIGQQYLFGKRPVAILSGGRVLYYFPPGDESLAAYGYISHSFASGLDMSEYYFVQMAARISMLDTTLKTAQVGSIRRYSSKSGENFIVVDGMVFDQYNNVVQFAYGGDGLNPGELIPLGVEDEIGPFGETMTFFDDVKSSIFELSASCRP